MQVPSISSNTYNPTFGMKYSRSVINNGKNQASKLIDTIELDNGKTISISTQLGDNKKPLEKFYILFDEAGEWVRFKIKTFYSTGKYSQVNVPNTETTREFLG